MASIAKLVVTLGANVSDFQTDLKRAGNLTKSELRKMERQAERLNKAWNRNFKLAGAAVAAGLVLATKSAIEFEKAMAEVSTLVEDTSGMEALGDAVKDVSIQFGKAPVEQAKALYQIISAGASTAAEQMEQLTVANKLAVGGVTDVATAADGLTSFLNAYAEQGLKAEDASDILFTTMKGGKTTIGELSSSIGSVATIAGQTGVKAHELGAAIATITKSGVSTTSAMEGLRGVLSAVLKQTEKTKNAAADLGIQFDVARIEAVGLDGILKDIENSGATKEQLSQLIGRVEALGSVMSLVANDSKDFNMQLESMETRAGATGTAVAKMMETTGQKADRARAAFEVLGIEIGEKFLASVANAADAIVKHIDAIAATIEALVIMLTIRLGIAGVAALGAATAATGGMAVAMAALGGPVGAVALAFGGLLLAVDAYYQRQLDAIPVVKNMTGLLTSQAKAYKEVAGTAALAALAIDMSDKYVALGKEVTNSTNAVIKANKAYLDSANLSGEFSQRTKQLKEEMERLELHAINTRKVFRAYGKELEKVTKETEDQVKETEALQEAVETATNEVEDMTEATMQAAEEADVFAESLQGILDRLYPLQAQGRALGNDLQILTQAFEDGTLSATQYDEAVRRATDAFSGIQVEAQKTVQEFDFLTTAIDEGARILERSFSTMWENLISGSENAFDTILDGFKSLLANLIHQATTQKITLNIQQGLAGTGTGPGGGINWQQLGGDLVQFASIIAGSAIGGGGAGATIGAGVGGLLGSAALSSLLPTLFGALGVFGGPLGTALGAAIGGILGGLFDSDRPLQLNVSGNQEWAQLSGSDTENLLKTIFGETFVTSRRADSGAIAELMKGISQFDEALGSFLSSDQIGAITTALKTWDTHLTGEAASLEQILNSRFKTILATFSDDVQAFVNRGADLAAQMDRLQVGVSAQNILDAAPDLFAGRTVTDFLNVVEAFQDGAETIGDAFNEVLAILNIVVGAVSTLRDFADSDLGTDFQTLLDSTGLSLSEALTGMTEGLMDAVANFSGSPEELQQIGLIVTSIREGELKLLAQIDSIQKGLTQNLEKLKNDILGISAPDQTGQQLLGQASQLLESLFSADAGEVAAIAQQFEALIRQISPEDQAAMAGDIVSLIDTFQATADNQLALLKQNALDAAADARLLVDEFLLNIGDPLKIVADSNQAAADSLGVIEENQVTQDKLAEQSAMDRDAMSAVISAGMDGISGEVGSIGPIVASAIRQGMSSINIIVNNEINDPLVNE